mgnify:CR=1 FL=1
MVTLLVLQRMYLRATWAAASPLRWRPATKVVTTRATRRRATASALRIEERTAAKASRDFQRADQIRDDLEAQGVVLEDGPKGTQWRRRN